MPAPVLDAPISQLRQRLIDDMTMRRFSQETPRNYVRDVGRFASFLGRPPDTATADDLRRFQVEQQEDGVPVPTMNSIVSALRFFFPHAVDRPDLARKLVRLTADPDVARTQWVVPMRFWKELEHMLSVNPTVGPDDAAMAEQAKVLVALGKRDPKWQALLDHAVQQADADLHAAAKYEHVGVDVGNGWQRQKNGGLWGADWFGRAQAAVVYILVNDCHEAIYFIRGTDSKGALLDGKHSYTMTFPKDALPPVDRSKGGFWSLTMYDKDYFMLPNSPNGRTNIGTVSLDADELKFAEDGALTLTMSAAEPTDAAAKANWLPASAGQFALIVRAYVPGQGILDGSYKFPDVERQH
jgi:hypothetical protein